MPVELGGEARIEPWPSVSGRSVAAQYLSVMPSQALVDVEGDLVFFSSIVGVGLFLQALVAEHADQAFVQDVVAERLRRAVARDQRVGIERDRRGALVRRPRP